MKMRQPTSWKRIAAVFSMDLLLGFLLLSGPLNQLLSLAWLVEIVGLVGLPLLIGLLKTDKYLLCLLGANVGLALLCGEIFRTMSAFLDAYLIGTALALLLALNLSVRRR